MNQDQAAYRPRVADGLLAADLRRAGAVQVRVSVREWFVR